MESSNDKLLYQSGTILHRIRSRYDTPKLQSMISSMDWYMETEALETLVFYHTGKYYKKKPLQYWNTIHDIPHTCYLIRIKDASGNYSIIMDKDDINFTNIQEYEWSDGNGWYPCVKYE